MEVILLEKIKNLGSLGDKVAVKAGYARNYLIPQEKAVLATSNNIAAFEARRAELEKKQGETLAYAHTRSTALANMTVVVAERVGMEGKLFGSVNAADIAKAVTAAGVELTKQEVRLATGPLRHVGDYQVDIHLHTDVNTTITVQVIEEA